MGIDDVVAKSAQARGAGLPTSVRVLAVVLALGGALCFFVGLFDEFEGARPWNLPAADYWRLALVGLAIGYGLLDGRRWAYLGAIVLCAVVIGRGAIGAFTAVDPRVIAAEWLLSALALWMLLRPQARAHFRPDNTQGASSGAGRA